MNYELRSSKTEHQLHSTRRLYARRNVGVGDLGTFDDVDVRTDLFCRNDKCHKAASDF